MSMNSTVTPLLMWFLMLEIKVICTRSMIYYSTSYMLFSGIFYAVCQLTETKVQSLTKEWPESNQWHRGNGKNQFTGTSQLQRESKSCLTFFAR